MRKKLILLLMSIFLIVGYAGVEKIVISNEDNIVFAETNEGPVDDPDPIDKDHNGDTGSDDSDGSLGSGDKGDKNKKDKDKNKPSEENENKKDKDNNDDKKPKKDKKTDDKKDTDSNETRNNDTPIRQPTTPPIQPTPTNQFEQEPEPITDEVEGVEEEPEEDVDEETEEADEEEKSKNDDGYLTLAQLKETEVMITQEDGEFYAIYKDDDDNVVKQKITEFAALQLGYEKEVIEKEDEQIESVALTSNKNDGLFKKMFGIISAGTIIIGLIIGTYLYYRREMT